MNHFTFAIVLGVCALAAGGIYAGKVMSDVKRTENIAAETLDTADHANRLAEQTIGDPTFKTQEKKIGAARAEVKELETFFLDMDARAIDFWFTPLNTAWTAEPDPESFKRFYNLATDQLFREIGEEVGGLKLADTLRQMIDHPFMHEAVLPDAKDLRMLQREFWIQDRVIRAFARAGAVMTRPLRGGETQNGLGPRAGQARFDRVRFDAQVICRKEDLPRVLHTLESPFDVTHEDGNKERLACPAIVDNVTIRALALDAQTVARYAGEPPVEVTLYFTIVDFQPARR